MKGRIISITVALILLAALIYISGPEKIAAVLLQANLLIASTALLFFSAGIILRTQRWRFLLRQAKISVPFFTAMKIYIASLFLSNITPGKTGDPIRSVLLKKVSGDSVGASLPSIIVERALDVASMIVIGALGIAFVVASATAQMIEWFAIAIAIYVVIFSVAVFAVSSEGRAKWSASLLRRIASRLPKIRKYEGKIETLILGMQKSMSAYKSKSVLSISAAYSFAIWTVEGVIIYIAFLALGFNVSLAAAVTSLSVTTLIAVITFLPGGIGAAEFTSVAFFASITALTMADITAVAILSRVLSYWITIVLGAFLLATMKYKYKV
jgi:uncharacterized protein (TIRG00374 family)